MKANVGDFVTAIVSFGDGGLGVKTPSFIVQDRFNPDPDISYRMHLGIPNYLGSIEVEDYDQRFDCHFCYRDDGRIVNAVKILEIADNMDNLVIDCSNVVIPPSVSPPMDDLYEIDLDPSDYPYFRALMLLPAVMYDRFIANNCNIIDTHREFIDQIRQGIY